MSARRRTLLYNASKANTNDVTDIDVFDDNAKIVSNENLNVSAQRSRRLSRAPNDFNK